MRFISIAIGLLLWATNVFAVHIGGTSHNDIVYLLNADPNTVHRFDLSTEQWLDDINLPITDTPTHMAIDDSGIYISYESTIYRYDLNGANQIHVADAEYAISDLVTIGGILVIRENILTTIDQTTLAVIATYDSREVEYLKIGFSTANSMLRIYGRTSGVSPSDIGYIEIDNTGAIISAKRSPYHGDYPYASKTWVSPDETKVVDDAGIVYTTQSLSYVGNLAGRFDRLAFAGDLPVLLRGRELIAYNNGLMETGTYTLDFSDADEIFSNNSEVFIFKNNISGYIMQRVLLNDFSPPQPGDPINPDGLAFTPDAYAYDYDDNVIFLLSKNHKNVFRWSIDDEKYLESIPLIGEPEYMSVDTESNIIYLAYNTGRITKIELNESELSEQYIISLLHSPLGLVQIGSFLFVAENDYPSTIHYTFNSDGHLVSEVDRSDDSKEYIWSEINQKIYYLEDNYGRAYDLKWLEISSITGEIDRIHRSPYRQEEWMTLPTRVSPDGSVVILGSGRILDAISLDQLHTLSNGILDAIWINGLLVTLDANSFSTNIQMWTQTYNPDRELLLDGDPLRIFSVYGKLLVIRSFSGIPYFNLFDLNKPLNDQIEFEINTKNYFPLEAGMEWTYLKNGVKSNRETVLNKKEKIHGKVCRIVESNYGKNKAYYSVSDGPIELHKEFQKSVKVSGLGKTDVKIVYNPGMIIMPEKFTSLGQKIKATGNVKITFAGYETIVAKYKTTITLLGYERVTVPYGDFGAFKISQTFKLVNKPYFNESTTSNIWLVKDIGMIKSETTSNGKARSSVLSNFTVPPEWIILSSDDFESDWGNFSDGGTDCRRSFKDKRFAHQGDYCVRIRDNSGIGSSFYYNNSYDIYTAGYTQLQVNFWFCAKSMENKECFFVDFYDGEKWITAKKIVSGKDFKNNKYYKKTVTINESGMFKFTTNMNIRFRCKASNNQDMVYIDQVVVSAR